MTSDSPLSRDDLLQYYDLEKVVMVSSSYIVKDSDDILFVTANSPVSITFPLAKGGRRVIISRVWGSSPVTLVAPSGQTIDGASTQTISTSFTPYRLKAVKGLGYLGI